MGNEITILERMKAVQKSGCKVCPRCGRLSIKEPIHINALSRVADIYVCDDCGVDEALRDFAKIPLPVEDWALASQED